MGAASGTLVGLAATNFVRDSPSAEVVSLYLVIGALVGATCWPWLKAVASVIGVVLGIGRGLGRLIVGAARAQSFAPPKPLADASRATGWSSYRTSWPASGAGAK